MSYKLGRAGLPIRTRAAATALGACRFRGFPDGDRQTPIHVPVAEVLHDAQLGAGKLASYLFAAKRGVTEIGEAMVVAALVVPSRALHKLGANYPAAQRYRAPDGLRQANLDFTSSQPLEHGASAAFGSTKATGASYVPDHTIPQRG